MLCYPAGWSRGDMTPTGLRKNRRVGRRPRLGVLHTACEPHAASSERSVRALMRLGARRGFDMVALDKMALDRVDDLAGLFIRDLTSPRNHTFAFARAAEARGIPVLDDTRSIERCSDKALLHIELTKHGISAPRSSILTPATALSAAIPELGLPLVLKLPEGSFSSGVFRVSSAAEAGAKLEELFARSNVVVAQEYLPTAFDWRIGVLAGDPLFACRYHMAPGHWQIINHDARNPDEGRVEALPVRDAPAEVVALARRAATLMGEGLYGVDIKQRGDAFFVIEVNDNPDIHHEHEASCAADRVWERLLGWFADRANARPSALPSAA